MSTEKTQEKVIKIKRNTKKQSYAWKKCPSFKFFMKVLKMLLVSNSYKWDMKVLDVLLTILCHIRNTFILQSKPLIIKKFLQ